LISHIYKVTREPQVKEKVLLLFPSSFITAYKMTNWL